MKIASNLSNFVKIQKPMAKKNIFRPPKKNFNTFQELKKFASNKKLPPLVKDPRASLQKSLKIQKEFHLTRGTQFKNSNKNFAALRSYENAQYFLKGDVDGAKKAHKIRLGLITDFKA